MLVLCYPVTEKPPAYETLGCFKDAPNRAIPTLERIESILDGRYKSRQNPIEKCYNAALARGYKVFALQDGGWCASSSDASETYDKYGASSDCKADGLGGSWANQVYQINGLWDFNITYSKHWEWMVHGKKMRGGCDFRPSLNNLVKYVVPHDSSQLYAFSER